MIWVSFYLEFEGEGVRLGSWGKDPSQAKFLNWQLDLAPMWLAWWTPADILKVPFKYPTDKVGR